VAAPLAAAAAIIAIVIGVRGGPSGLDEPSRVVSGPGPDPTSVMLGDSHIVLDPDTALVMSHEAEHPTVLVERGGAWFTVAPRMSRPAFIVRAGDAMVRVVGTRFRVARSDERIAVEVERGLVNVNFRGSMVAVGAGQRWSSEVGRTMTAAAVSPPADPAPAEPVGEVADPPTPAVTPPTPPRPTRPHRAPRPTGSADLRAESRPGAPESDPRAGTDADASKLDRDQAEYDRARRRPPRSPRRDLARHLPAAVPRRRERDRRPAAPGSLEGRQAVALAITAGGRAAGCRAAARETRRARSG
jgi:transmembrane sensor